MINGTRVTEANGPSGSNEVLATKSAEQPPGQTHYSTQRRHDRPHLLPADPAASRLTWRILMKLGLRDRVQVLVFAHRNGLTG